MRYYEQPYNYKKSPIISIPIILVTFLHIIVSALVYYAVEIDLTGYPSTILEPLPVFSIFFMLLTLLVEVKNKSAGLLDMIVVCIAAIGTYFVFI